MSSSGPIAYFCVVRDDCPGWDCGHHHSTLGGIWVCRDQCLASDETRHYLFELRIATRRRARAIAGDLSRDDMRVTTYSITTRIPVELYPTRPIRYPRFFHLIEADGQGRIVGRHWTAYAVCEAAYPSHWETLKAMRGGRQ